jgi:hypothetical protein
MLDCSPTQQHWYSSSTAATSGSTIRAFFAVVSARCHILPQQHCHKCFHCRASRSWPRSSKPPIIFMGLLDTVGAEGIPRIKPQGDPASAFTCEYCFRDPIVSSEVQHVFQAVSTHDRLAPFEPCAVRRSRKLLEGEGSSSSSSSVGHYPGVEFSLQEVWFPGKHCSQASCVAP